MSHSEFVDEVYTGFGSEGHSGLQTCVGVAFVQVRALVCCNRSSACIFPGRLPTFDSNSMANTVGEGIAVSSL